jgi:hypothetical protein
LLSSATTCGEETFTTSMSSVKLVHVCSNLGSG